jgi:AraC-like DNA-binding protein
MTLWLSAFSTFFSIGAAALLAALALRDARQSLPARLLIFLVASVSGVLLTSLAPPLAPPEVIWIPLRVVAAGNLVAAWWFARALFDDGLRLGAREWLAATALSAFQILYLLRDLGIGVPTVPAPWQWMGFLPPAFIVAHLIVLVLFGWRDDLVEPRRRLRPWVVGLIVAASLASLGAEWLLPHPSGATLRAAAVAAAAMLLGMALLRFSAGTLTFSEPASHASPDEDASKALSASANLATAASAAKHALSVRDQPLLEKLQHAMREDRAYLDPDLTIGSLATRLGVSEPRLRQLINRGLGHRNFANFVAQARVEAAKAALSDPRKASESILSIAMDTGFPTLATFNRAFKAITGLTPSEYRADALGRALQN